MGKIIRVSTSGMDKDTWLSYRSRGIGASDVSTVLGLNQYKSSLELYYQKIGEVPVFDVENLAMFLGTEQEDLVSTLWEYWDGSEEGMIRNYRDGNKIRRCKRVNAYIHNSDYPWLFVSLDREINKTEGKGNGTLEIKLIGGYEADKWVSGLPPGYVIQVQTQMLVPEYDFGEMAILQDNRKFFVYPFEPSQNIQNHIIEKTKDFWDRVVKARKLVNEKYLSMTQFNQKRVDEMTHEIDALAPEPDGTLAYADYLKVRFNRPATAERRGSEEELKAAKLQRDTAKFMKEVEESKILQENILKKAMGDDIQVLDFGTEGKVFWTKTEKGGRIFRNKLK